MAFPVPEYSEFVLYLVVETEKAAMLSPVNPLDEDYDMNGHPFWVPKSQVIIRDYEGDPDRRIVFIPDWLERKIKQL